MKKGIHYWALPKAYTLREKMKFAKEAGFDGLELVITETGELTLSNTRKELEAIKQMAMEEEITLLALSSSLNWKASLTSNRQEIRERAKELLIRQLEIGAELGIEIILALPGFVTVDFITDALHPAVSTHDVKSYYPGQENIDYETAFSRSLSAFREIAPIAEELGVTIGIENIWNHFLLSPVEMKDLIDSIHSEAVGAYLDIGNVYPWGYPEHWIRTLGHRIKRVHVKDFVKGSSSIRGFTDLLNGDIPFLSVMKALRQIGYDGWITAEVNEKPEFPEYTARAAKLALDYILSERGGSNV